MKQLRWNRILALGGLLLMAGLVSCEHEQGRVTEPLQVTFSSIQDNIFTPKCVNAGCHPGGGAPMSLAKGVAFNNLVNVTATRYSPMVRVKPGDADNSVLYLKVKGDPQTGFRMPFGAGPLSNDEIDSIRDWINQGAQNN